MWGRKRKNKKDDSSKKKGSSKGKGKKKVSSKKKVSKKKVPKKAKKQKSTTSQSKYAKSVYPKKKAPKRTTSSQKKKPQPKLSIKKPSQKTYSGPKILLRCRGKDGMFRLNLHTDQTVGDIKFGIFEHNRVDPPQLEIFVDQRCTPPAMLSSRKISEYRLRNGHMLFYKYSAKIISKQEYEAEKVREKKKKIGDGSDLNNLGLRYKSKHWTMNEYLAHVDKTTIKIKSQANSVCKAIHVDQFSAQEFHKYLNNTAFQEQRCGWLIGSIRQISKKKKKNDDDEEEEGDSDSEYESESDSDEEPLTWEEKKALAEEAKKAKYIDKSEHDYVELFVDAIYEPKQSGDMNGFLELKDEFLNAVDRVSSCLRKSRVGYIFSYIGKRKVPLLGKELLRAARMQAEHGEHFVTITLTINEKHAVQFEAFQVSKQCVDLYKRGFLSEHKEDPTKLALKKPVNYSGKVVQEVDCIIFTVNVAIKDFVSDFMVQFPIRNRKGSQYNQTIKKMKEVFGRRRNQPYYQQLRDVHMLLFLTNILSLKTDFPRLCDGILNKSNSKLTNFKELINAYLNQ